jgi:hypothetical protein
MTSQNPTAVRPAAAGSPESGLGTRTGSREERLAALRAKWEQFVAEYAQARARRDEELMTNLRGLLLLIKKEKRRLGADLPPFPSEGEHHLADL